MPHFPITMAPETRSQERARKTTFPFLKFPGELRNMIYELALHVWNEINKLTALIHGLKGKINKRRARLETVDREMDPDRGLRLERYPEILFDRILPKNYAVVINVLGHFQPTPAYSTPSLLLVNKEIHEETHKLLLSKPLILHWPLFDDQLYSMYSLDKFLSQRTFRQIRHLEVIVRRKWNFFLRGTIQTSSMTLLSGSQGEKFPCKPCSIYFVKACFVHSLFIMDPVLINNVWSHDIGVAI
ncbi:hypothetical protein EJ08DRAFT_326739 [Tothia fuscella]|uniref:Uncharacterized protein n=1 Tax=Tothia fuscella TaxID=1048955 RepID=A0A9P4NNN6_9PEZI|nr:hypothetical protein EJ08DRAFT_326739 [Tothia fuscella]